MLLVEHDDIVQTLATDTADDPLAVGILPWTAWRNLHLVNTHVADALVKIRAVDRVSIPQEIPRRFIPGKRVDNLLGGSLRGGMLGHIDMDNAAALVRKHDEHERHLESDGRHGEEVTRHEVFNMVDQERLPRW
jgi:hypothetical protein